MRAFCTSCWAEVDAAQSICPVCGFDIRSDPRSYDDKISSALRHPLPETRARVCELAGRRRMRTAVPILIERTTDPDTYVRVAALDALGEIGDLRALGPVERNCRDRSLLVREAALRARSRLSAIASVGSPG